MKTYQVDDYLVHESSGVCRVKEISEKALQGKGSEKLYYTLEPVFANGTMLTTPVDTKARIRDVVEADEYDALLQRLPQIPVLEEENTRARTELYKEEMAKFEIDALAGVLKTVFLRREMRIAEGKKVMASDEKVLQLASKRLFEEMSFATGRPIEEIEESFYAVLEPERQAAVASVSA